MVNNMDMNFFVLFIIYFSYLDSYAAVRLFITAWFKYFYIDKKPDTFIDVNKFSGFFIFIRRFLLILRVHRVEG